MRWDLLDRFLRDACDEVERAEVESWVAASARNRQALDALVEVIRAADEPPSVRSEWERLRRALQIESEPGDDEKPDSS